MSAVQVTVVLGTLGSILMLHETGGRKECSSTALNCLDHSANEQLCPLKSPKMHVFFFYLPSTVTFISLDMKRFI